MRQRDDGSLELSATDAANALSCSHITALDRDAARGGQSRPWSANPLLDLLRARGAAHEKAYVAGLRAIGLSVVELAEVESSERQARTLAAMKQGAGAIIQGELGHGAWVGRPDVLLRVERASAEWAWSYEPVDTKLAEDTRAGTMLQLWSHRVPPSDIVMRTTPPSPRWCPAGSRRPWPDRVRWTPTPSPSPAVTPATGLPAVSSVDGMTITSHSWPTPRGCSGWNWRSTASPA
jgi:hypothetical protein